MNRPPIYLLTIAAIGAGWSYYDGVHMSHCAPAACEEERWKQPDGPHRELPTNPAVAPVTITVESSATSTVGVIVRSAHGEQG